MNEYAVSLKENLTSLIREMSAAPAPYVKEPDTDFTRKKKLPFETVMHLLISMGGNKSAFADWNGFPLFFSRCNLLNF